MKLLKLYVAGIFLLSATTFAAQVTIFGPQKLSPGLFSANQKTYSVIAADNNINSNLLVIAGSGADLSPAICTGKITQFIFCQVANLVRVLEIAITRPSAVEVKINNVAVVSNNYVPAKGRLEIVSKVNMTNSVSIKVSGLFTSSANFEIKAENSVPNVLPIALFSANPTTGYAPLLVSFSGLSSRDTDGSIVAYDWDFNDGSLSSGSIASHLFASSGNYAVKLTVTDNKGGKGTVTYSINVLNNQRPLASFFASTATDLGSLQLHVDASQSRDTDGQLVEYAWDFGDSKVGSGVTADHIYSAQGSYAIKLTVKDNLGATTSLIKNVEIFDRRKPMITLRSPASGKTVYFTSLPTQMNVAGSSDEPLSQVAVNSQLTGIAADKASFSYNYSVMQSGFQNILVKATDLFGNVSEISVPVTVVLDNIAPQINVSSPLSLTNQSTAIISISVAEANDVTTVIKVNDVALDSVSEKNFSQTVSLTKEGSNSIEIQSTDIAGNKSAVSKIIINKDSIPATLSSLQPANNSNLDRVVFPVSGASNEKLSEIKINGMLLSLSSDGLSFSGNYVAAGQGVQPLLWEAVDVAGNHTTFATGVTVSSRLLITELLSVVPSSDGIHLNIVGSSGAARPGVKLKATTGLFSFNRAEGIAENMGAFKLQLDPFSSATVTALDESTGEEASAVVTYSTQTRLSGIVRDTEGNPLPGATVSIVGSQLSSLTDSSGVFNITNSLSGDQTLLIDGSTIPQTVTGPSRIFSKTNVVINIGLTQQNILERPIYLTPLMLDGSQTSVSQSVGATVTTPAAPGVSLEVPPNVALFPDGTKAGVINLATIDSSKTTIEVPQAAMPSKVVSLEPSGLSFSRRVPIKLPNDNELPAGVEMVILSMNSAKGVWEVDGLAKVSSDGQSVESKPGHGISHFSLVYAVPIKPLITAMSDEKLAGVDVSKGSFSTSLKLPSYKAMNTEIAPQLIYKSAWANPTAYVTNSFDIPRTEVKVSEQDYIAGNYKLTYQRCQLFFCFPFVKDFYVQIERSADYTSWYEPQSIKSQLFVGAIGSDEVNFVNSSSTGSNIESLPGIEFAQGFSSAVSTYQGIPNQSRISYAVQLKDPVSNEFLPSGMYPTLARFQIKLRNMVLTTVTQKAVIEGQAPQVTKQSYAQTRTLDDALPADVATSVLVQSKVKSPAGRGWHIAGPQKILTPNNNRILIEEANGDLSTYAISNTIETLFNGNSSSVNLDYGVGLSQWPYAYAQSTNASDDASVVKIDLASVGSNPTVVANLLRASGAIGNEGTYNCPASNYAASFNPSQSSYKVVPKLGGITVGPNGSIYGSDLRQHMLFSGLNSLTKIAGASGSIEAVSGIRPPGFSFSSVDLNQWCKINLGSECGSPQVQEAIPCDEVRPVVCVPGTFCKPTEVRSFVESSGDVGYGDLSGDALAGAMVSNPGAIALNSPQAMAFSSNGDLVVADTGNNRIRKLNLVTNTIRTLAGNGSNIDNGNGNSALQAGIYHPSGVVYDSQGNLFISTENGYIRKVDVSGVISTVAGLPLNLGGVLSDEAPASKMSLNKPSGMAIDDSNGFLYVAETGGHRVIRIDLQANIASTVAGNGQCIEGNIGDGGPSLSASLCSPTNVGLDSSRNLTIVDSGHKRIRRVNFRTAASGILSFSPTNQDRSILSRDQNSNWVRVYRNGSTVAFNNAGLAVSILDAEGRQSSYEYDTNGNVTAFVDPAQLRTEYLYSGTKLSSIKDPAGRTTNFIYNGDLLSEVRLPDGSKRSYTYNASALMIRETNERGKSNQYTYNEWNRLEAKIDPDGNYVTINDSTSASMANNFTNGQSGPIPNSGFGESQVKDVVKDSKNIATAMTRNHNGYVNTVVDSSGKTTLIDRDLLGNPLKITYPDLKTVDFTYDPTTNDLVKIEDGRGGTTKTFVYNQKGNLAVESSSNGITTTNTYDSSGRIVQISDSSNKRVMFTYNALGLVTAKTLFPSSGISTSESMEYDSMGRMVRMISSAGKTTERVYDLAGNVIKTISKIDGSRTSTTIYEYDVMNRVTKVFSPNGEATAYSYLPTGEIFQITNPKGQVTQFDYNFSGQLTRKLEPNGAVYSFSYEAGNLTYQTDPKGISRHFVYDEQNRLKQITFPDDIVLVNYDADGRVANIHNNVSNVSYGYDDRGATSSVKVDGLDSMSGFPSVELQYSFNSDGQVAGMTSSIGSVSYGYDSGGRLSAISNTLGEMFSFGFDDTNRLTQLQRPGSQSYYAYADSGILQSINHVSNGTTKSFVEYAYDQRNFPIQKRNFAGTSTYAYDLSGQLTGAGSLGNSESFSYDSLGNRVNDASGNYVYDSLSDLLKEDWQYSYTYDLNGNLTQKLPKDQTKPAYMYAYSSKNQLIEVSITATALGQIVKKINYTYDVLGRRMQKSVWDRVEQVNPKKTYVRRYVYDATNVFAEFDGSNNLLASYVHGNTADDVLSVSVTAAGVTAGVAKSAGKYYFLKDALGTVTDVLDSSGALIQTQNYGTFGKPVSIKNSSGVEVIEDPSLRLNYGFTGREWDEESNLYHFRARFYDPSLGRFMQKDPDPGQLQNPITFNNKYIFGGNSPLVNRDPSGASWEDTRKWIEDAVIAVVTIVLIVVSDGQAITASNYATLIYNAAIAVGSVAGGALAASAAFSAFQGGNFWDNVGNNFHTTFRIGAAFLALSAVLAWTFGGGVGVAGGNGLQGFVTSTNGYGPFQGALTLGSAASYNGATPASNIYAEGEFVTTFANHEFGHTLQFIGMAAIAGASGASSMDIVWQSYVGFGIIGTIPVVGAPWEGMASFLGK